MSDAPEDDQSAKSGYSFIATVISAGILGYIIDQVAPTAPWGLIGFMIIGIIYATYKAQKSMNPKTDETETKKDEKKL